MKDGNSIRSIENIFRKDEVDANDTGDYSCTAENDKGKENVTQRILVLGKLCTLLCVNMVLPMLFLFIFYLLKPFII